eukprot:5012816-Prymnesium_polylepis.1
MYGSRVLVGRMIVQHSCAIHVALFASEQHACLCEGLRRAGSSSCAHSLSARAEARALGTL